MATTIRLGTGPTLNTTDSDGVIWRVNQSGFTGWGEPPTTLLPTQRVRAPGAWAGDAFSMGRTVTISGTITAPTPALSNTAIDSLIAAVTAATFTFTVTENGAPWTAGVRRQGETIITKLTDKHTNYSIQVFAVDARKFGTPQSGSTNLPASTGGLVWPHTWPETWSATTISGQVALTNMGNTTGSVVLRIDGPVTGPSIAHSGTGAPITFSSSLVLGAGEWLTINLDTHQVLANDQANRAQYITSAGWSGFDPGVNIWSFAAAVYNTSALLTVTALPAKR